MKKFILSSTLLVITAIPVWAQKTTDANIMGHIKDSRTHQHMVYATITVEGTEIGTATDATGHYFLKNLPEGTYTFEASMLGYATQKKVATITGNKTVELNFELTDDTMAVEQIVVSSNRSSTIRRNTSSLVNVVTNKQLTLTNSCSVADGLIFQPGVRVEDNCQNCGFTQVRINGLDGHYSQILIDSRPIFSSLTGVYGLEHIPANMIDRIEVVRGGGSALFGSAAIGGTINIITKDPLYSSAEVSHTTTTIGMSNALDSRTSANISLVSDNNRAGMLIYGLVRRRDSYDHNGDGFSEIPTIDNHTLGLRSFLKTSKRSKLTMQYSGVNEYRRGGNNLHLPPHQADIAEQTDHTINNGGLNFDAYSREAKHRLNLYSSFQQTARKSYYGGHKDEKAYGTTDDLVWVSGTQYTYSMDRLVFMPAEFVAGVEYNYNNLVDQSVGYDTRTNQTIHIFSAFAQNEWRNNRFGLLVGARVDKHNLIAKPVFSPRVNIRYNPTDDISFRATYSTGFRAPQAFDEDFHIAVVGGERVSTVLAADLRHESSQSVSISADSYKTFGRLKMNLLVECFYTGLKDVFALRELSETNAAGDKVMERYNGSGARVAGITIESKAAIGSHFQLQGGMTLQRSRFDSPEQWSDDPAVPAVTDMFRTPNVYGYLTSYLYPTKHLELSATGTYTGRMTVQHFAGSGTPTDVAVRTPDFFDLNVKLSYEFVLRSTMRLHIYAGMQNILNAYQRDFDSGVDRDSGYIYGPTMPRSLYVGAKIAF